MAIITNTAFTLMRCYADIYFSPPRHCERCADVSATLFADALITLR